jgi:hypothetical protein
MSSGPATSAKPDAAAAAEAAAASKAATAAAQRLTAQEHIAVDDAAAATADETAAYLAEHPELLAIVQAFTKAALDAKPGDVLQFAKDYFESKL